ncbi:MAG: ROK family protein [Myxococcales bacterium]
MKPRDEVIVGIDVGATTVRAAVVDPGGRILGEDKHRLVSKEPPQVVEAIVRAAKTACGAAGFPFAEMRALGVGVAGQVARGNGTVTSAPGLGWHDVDLVKLIQAKAPKAFVKLTSDLAAAAWAERATGAGKGADDLLVVSVGPTVGAGIVLAGKLHEGASGAAGDLAHVNVHPGGRTCACGQRGCLEAYATSASLAAWARDDLRIAAAAAKAMGKHSSAGRRLLEFVAADPERITVAAMERAAADGEDLSAHLLDEAARLVGLAVANLVNALNPARLLLGGTLLAQSPRMRSGVRESIGQHVSKAASAALEVCESSLGEEAVLIGAAMIASEAARA